MKTTTKILIITSVCAAVLVFAAYAVAAQYGGALRWPVFAGIVAVFVFFVAGAAREVYYNHYLQ